MLIQYRLITRLLNIQMPQILAVFDFDHTIINKNSDVVLRDMLPNDVLGNEKMKGLRPSWTAYMAEVFRQLPLHGVKKDCILKTCETLEPSDGMVDLLNYLSDIEAEIIILSDANTEIIEAWLEKNVPDFKGKVITNPAIWSEDVLKVKPYHHQTSCKLCPINLCKGSVLTKYLENRSFDLVCYAGDGKNDYCPSKSLRECDLVFPRSGYQLDKTLKNTAILAEVCVWTSAAEIKARISQYLVA